MTTSASTPTTAANSKPLILASAVVLVDTDGRVLVCERPEGKSWAGYWEFPGGKLDAGETPEQAAQREIMEEIGVKLGCMAPLSFISESRDDYHVAVFLFICREWKGIPQGLENQQMKWVRPRELPKLKLLPSNIPFIHVVAENV